MKNLKTYEQFLNEGLDAAGFRRAEGLVKTKDHQDLLDASHSMLNDLIDDGYSERDAADAIVAFATGSAGDKRAKGLVRAADLEKLTSAAASIKKEMRSEGFANGDPDDFIKDCVTKVAATLAEGSVHEGEKEKGNF